MRKVKVLALLLAALMVVAVFAGCADTDAIVADVEGLDERVSALEELLNNQKDAIDEVKDAIEADKTAEELKALQDSIKAQEEANKALQDLIKQLQEDLKKTDEKVEDLPVADANLETARKDATAKIATLKAVYEANKADYVAKDYEAILVLLEVAKGDVAAATKSADVAAIMTALDADLAKYTAYDDQLYIYVITLLGNISAESEDLVEEALEYLAEAQEHYGTNTDPITEYVYGVDEDDEDMVINLVAVLAAINNLQNGNENSYEVTINGETTEYASLAYITKQAKKIDKDFKKLADKEAAELISTNAAGNLYATYMTWLDLAKALGEKNVGLVTTAADIAELAEMVQNVADAKNAYAKLGKIDYTSGTYNDVLAPYTAWTAKELIDLVDGDSVKSSKKNIYDAIDAKIEGWKDDFGFDDEFAAAVIASIYGNDSYADYVADRDFVNYMEQAYSTFVKNIVPQIKAVNAIKAINSASVSAYVELEQAIEAWRVVVEEDEENDIDEVVVNNENLALMIARQKIAVEGGSTTYFDADGNVDMETIVAFENDDDDATIATFFNTEYEQAQTYAKELRKVFYNYGKSSNISAQTNILNALIIEGEWRKVSGINDEYATEEGIAAGDAEYDELLLYVDRYVEAADYECFDYYTEATYTIADFEELYGDYGLMSLLDAITPHSGNENTLAQFQAAKAKVEAVVEKANDEYATVLGAFGKIEYQLAYLNTTVASTYQYSPVYIEGVAEAPVFLVNLDDKATVEATVAARDAWKLANRAGAVRNFTEYVYENAEGEDVVLPGAYVLAPVANELVDIILDDVAGQITALSAKANALINHFEQLATALKFFAENAAFNIASSTNLGAYNFAAATGFTTYNNQEAVKHYRVYALAADSNGLASYSTTIYDNAVNPESYAGLCTVTGEGEEMTVEYMGTSLASMIEAGYALYQSTFASEAAGANVSYTEKTALVDGETVRYYSVWRKTYAPVEEAKALVAGLDVAYAQARIIANLVENAATIGETKLNSYIKATLAADTVAEYIAVYDLCFNETGVDLDQILVYNSTVKTTDLQ